MPNNVERNVSTTFLRRADWFGKLPSPLQQELVGRSRIVHCDPGQIVCGAYQPSKSFWILLQGQVVVAEVFPDGERFLFHIGGPGFCFGGAALLSPRPSGMEATASTKARLLLLPAAELDAVFASQPSLFRPFAELIMQRYHLVLRCLAWSRTLPLEEYLRVRLAMLAAMWRLDGYSDPVIEIVISQTEAASLLGLSRQTLNRYLAHLEVEGVIEVCFRSIRIVEPDRLGRLAEQDMMP